MNRYLGKFLTYLDVEKGYSHHTLKNYQVDLEEFFQFSKSLGDVKEIQYLHLRRFLAELKVRNFQPRSIARKLSSLRSFFKFLNREGFIEENPAVLLLTPKLNRTLPKFVSEKRNA